VNQFCDESQGRHACGPATLARQNV
jgi:hypothetical protein